MTAPALARINFGADACTGNRAVPSPSSLAVGAQVRGVLDRFPTLKLALLFGSVATGRQRPDSDLDIAIAAKHRLTVDENMDIIASLCEATGRPIDLVDLLERAGLIDAALAPRFWPEVLRLEDLVGRELASA